MDRQQTQLNADLSNKAYTTFTQEDIGSTFTGTDGKTWEVYAVSGNTQAANGFYGVAFRNTETKDVVTAFRGTDQLGVDGWTDLQIGMANVPNQYANAQEFYNSVKGKASKLGDNALTVTGHSLGGGLAQLVGAVNGAEAWTFNAPGVKEILDTGKLGTEPNS